MKLDKLGVWQSTDGMTATEAESKPRIASLPRASSDVPSLIVSDRFPASGVGNEPAAREPPQIEA